MIEIPVGGSAEFHRASESRSNSLPTPDALEAEGWARMCPERWPGSWVMFRRVIS